MTWVQRSSRLTQSRRYASMAFGPSVFARLSKKPASAIPYHGGLCKVETSRPASQAAGLRGDADKVYTLLRLIAYGLSRAFADLRASAAAVGRVRPRAGEQRHVVVLPHRGEAEVERYLVEE